MNKIFLLLVSIFFASSAHEQQKRAFVRVPVTDLVATPFGFASREQVVKAYQNLAHGDTDCQRAYQLLLHEMVEILEKQQHEVKVGVLHTYYHAIRRSCRLQVDRHSTYWMQKKDLVFLDTLPFEKTLLPRPVSFNCVNGACCNKGVVTLMMPFIDPVTGVTYSAGTRFVEKELHQEGVLVWVYDATMHTMQELLLPDQYYWRWVPKTYEQRCVDFIWLLRLWARQLDGFIPYLFSGASFTRLYREDVFTIREDPATGKMYYDRPMQPGEQKTGFDCSCLISRAAQIVGLPYFYKNSHTIVMHLQPVENEMAIRAGDIIWFPGHVMVVSDVAQQLLIEARGYGAGYGKVHELPLAKVFAGIATYTELYAAMCSHQPLTLLARDGSPRMTITRVSILSLQSDVSSNLR